MVRVTSVPEGVLKLVKRVTVPFAVFPVSSCRLAGDVESNPRLLVARMVKFPPAPLVFREKGTEKGVPATTTLSESA